VAARANFAGGADAAEIHGTAVAGIIAATADNGIGIYGVAPEAAVLAARACRPRVAGRAEGVCTSWSLARALDWALARQARVVNLSVAGPRDPLLADLVARAHERGVVVVAAVGNLGPASEPTYPAALPTVVGVTAVDARAALYAAAVQGPFVSVAAPGVEVLSAQPGAGFAVLTGTSMAAAHVSGVAALLLQARADLGPAGVRRALEGHAQALGPGTGHGLVDGCRAVSDALGGRLGC
jgi:subtilisin family serine protease